jgi:integrase
MEKGLKPRGRHPQNRLRPVEVKNKRKPGRYADGGGLYLVIDPSGVKRWVLRTVVQGRRRDMGLGGAAGSGSVSLADARTKADRFRRIARDGGDPFAERDKERRETLTFAQAAEIVFKARMNQWRNPKHRAQWINTIRTYANPVIGHRHVSQIDTPDILRVLAPIWNDKPETARRVKQRMATVFDWAKAAGHRDGDNPVHGVAKGLSDQRDRPKHHSAMPYAELPTFMKKLHDVEDAGATTLALEFLILTATRTSEVLHATWGEIDADSAVWTIPPERMKATREHRVPLSSSALLVLEQARQRSTGGDLIFPGRIYTKPLSGETMRKFLRRRGYAYTVHGFRSTFRDWAEERTGFSHNVCEMALAHSIRDKAEAAYRRGDLLEKRRELMDTWAAFVNSTDAVVVPIRAS